MPDRVLIRLGAGDRASWFDGSAHDGLPPAAAIGDRQVVVLVPAQDVLLTRQRLAAPSRAQLLRALPFAIEDRLLAPVEELHFAAVPAADDEVGVAVVARQRLRDWLERLAQAGIRADVLLPETLALPEATALIEDDHAAVRFAAFAALGATPDELPALLSALDPDEAVALDVRDCRVAPPLDLPPPVTAYRERQSGALAFLARGVDASPLNLLCGEFAPAHRGRRGARLWRLAALLAGLVVVLALAGRLVDNLRLARESSRLEAATVAAAKQAFPDLTDAELARTDPERLVRERIERVRGGAGAGANGVLPLLGAIAPVLGATNRVQTRGLEFRNGVLELGLRAPDVATLDALRERFAAVPGLRVEVTAANPTDAGVDGRIRIAGATP
jgi:general secretion pathway protein L